MRNIFDQYSQRENKVTHALAVCLNADRHLLAAFLKWLGISGIKADKLTVLEQSIPGRDMTGSELPGDDSRGLPDMWIHDEQGWCLLIESKLTAALTNDQLRRHKSTAQRAGFERTYVCSIDTVGPGRVTAMDVHRTWLEVYRWLVEQNRHRQSYLVKQLLRYLAHIEGELMNEDKMKIDGAMTEFSGIVFEDGYTYHEAKYLVRKVLSELRDRKTLAAIGVLGNVGGRSAIKGKARDSVWDYVPFRAGPFNKYPHLTFLIHRDFATGTLILPNKGQIFQRKLAKLSWDDFYKLIGKVNTNFMEKFSEEKGAVPFMLAQQRHFRAYTIQFRDGFLDFDLRTFFATGEKQAVKPQKVWLKTIHELIKTNQAVNLEIAIGVRFPYRDCAELVQSSKLLDAVSDVWISLKPLSDFLFE